MGNYCLQLFRKCFEKQSIPEMQTLNATELENQSENYTQVSYQEESYNDYSLQEILNLGDSIQQTAALSLELFLYRLKTSHDFEPMHKDESLIIEFHSYQLQNRFTIIQLKYSFKLHCTVEEFLNYKYLDHTEKYVEIEKEDQRSLIYTTNKKYQFLDEREYLFVKYQSQLPNGKYVQTIRSLDNINNLNGKIPLTHLTKGYILVSGFLIQDLGNEIYVDAYSEIDFQTKLPPGMMKKAIVLELKKVIYKLINN